MTKKYMHNIPEGVTLWVSCTLQLRDIRLAATELIENNWQIKLPDKRGSAYSLILLWPHTDESDRTVRKT